MADVDCDMWLLLNNDNNGLNIISFFLYFQVSNSLDTSQNVAVWWFTLEFNQNCVATDKTMKVVCWID